MLRRLLRRLRPPAPTPPPVRPPSAPDARFVDADGLAALRSSEPLCVDLRPIADLRYGFVEGAWLLPDLARCPPTARPVVLLAADPHAMLGAGLPVTWGGLSAWQAAGFAIREPEWKAPLPLLHPVAIDGAAGWIQDVAWAGDEFVYAVLLADGRRLAGLVEEAITPRGPRGAAGLGEQL